MKKSVYERSSGRTSAQQASVSTKSAHLTAARDPFKPRQLDAIVALVCPAAVFCYSWKRSALPLSSLHSFSSLYLYTGLLYTLCTIPWSFASAQNKFEFPPPALKTVIGAWPWYNYARWLFLLPFAVQVAFAVKAWWRAKRVTELAIVRAEEREWDPSESFDVDRQFINLGEGNPLASCVNDLFGMHLREADLDLSQLIQPPTPKDVGGEDEFEENIVPSLPAILPAWYGPMRVFNLLMGGAAFVVFHALSDLFILLLGLPFTFIFKWTQTSSRPAMSDCVQMYRLIFFGGLWNFGCTMGGSIFLLGMSFLGYRFAKQTGVMMQMNSVF